MIGSARARLLCRSATIGDACQSKKAKNPLDLFRHRTTGLKDFSYLAPDRTDGHGLCAAVIFLITITDDLALPIIYA